MGDKPAPRFTASTARLVTLRTSPAVAQTPHEPSGARAATADAKLAELGALTTAPATLPGSSSLPLSVSNGTTPTSSASSTRTVSMVSEVSRPVSGTSVASAASDPSKVVHPPPASHLRTATSAAGFPTVDFTTHGSVAQKRSSPPAMAGPSTGPSRLPSRPHGPNIHFAATATLTISTTKDMPRQDQSQAEAKKAQEATPLEMLRAMHLERLIPCFQDANIETVDQLKYFSTNISSAPPDAPPDVRESYSEWVKFAAAKKHLILVDRLGKAVVNRFLSAVRYPSCFDLVPESVHRVTAITPALLDGMKLFSQLFNWESFFFLYFGSGLVKTLEFEGPIKVGHLLAALNSVKSTTSKFYYFDNVENRELVIYAPQLKATAFQVVLLVPTLDRALHLSAEPTAPELMAEFFLSALYGAVVCPLTLDPRTRSASSWLAPPCTLCLALREKIRAFGALFMSDVHEYMLRHMDMLPTSSTGPTHFYRPSYFYQGDGQFPVYRPPKHAIGECTNELLRRLSGILKESYQRQVNDSLHIAGQPVGQAFSLAHDYCMPTFSRHPAAGPLANLEALFGVNLVSENLSDRSPVSVLLSIPAGYGKSVLCDQLCFQWAQSSLWKDTFSLVLRLTLAPLSADATRPEDFAEFLFQNLGGWAKGHFLDAEREELIEAIRTALTDPAYRFLLIVDVESMDLEDMQSSALPFLLEKTEQFFNLHLVLTCRPHLANTIMRRARAPFRIVYTNQGFDSMSLANTYSETMLRNAALKASFTVTDGNVAAWVYSLSHQLHSGLMVSPFFGNLAIVNSLFQEEFLKRSAARICYEVLRIFVQTQFNKLRSSNNRGYLSTLLRFATTASADSVLPERLEDLLSKLTGGMDDSATGEFSFPALLCAVGEYVHLRSTESTFGSERAYAAGLHAKLRIALTLGLVEAEFSFDPEPKYVVPCATMAAFLQALYLIREPSKLLAFTLSTFKSASSSYLPLHLLVGMFSPLQYFSLIEQLRASGSSVATEVYLSLRAQYLKAKAEEPEQVSPLAIFNKCHVYGSVPVIFKAPSLPWSHFRALDPNWRVTSLSLIQSAEAECPDDVARDDSCSCAGLYHVGQQLKHSDKLTSFTLQGLRPDECVHRKSLTSRASDASERGSPLFSHSTKFLPLFQSISNLVYLCMRACSLNDAIVSQLVVPLKENTHLEALDLTDNRIAGAGATEFEHLLVLFEVQKRSVPLKICLCLNRGIELAKVPPYLASAWTCCCFQACSTHFPKPKADQNAMST
eukprot:m.813262 g.813262  ORF g.813262 m.813262 type:complete len:1262 (+) comp59358_c0_seq1:142-3927(+)